MESVVTVRIPIGCYPVDCQITGRFDSRIIQLEGGILIPIGTDGDVAGRSRCGRGTGMNFPTNVYSAARNVDSMVCIDGTMIIISNVGIVSSYSHGTGAFDVHRIQCLRFTNVSFQADCTASSSDIQTGISQVGFLDKTYSSSTTHGSIIPFAMSTIPYGQERGTIIRLGTGNIDTFFIRCRCLVGPGIPVHIAIYIASLVIRIGLPITA